jgi:hypothetical protein
MSKIFISGRLAWSLGRARHHATISSGPFNYLTHCLGKSTEAVWGIAHDLEFILLHFAKPIRLRVMLCCGGFALRTRSGKPFLTGFGVHLPHLDLRVVPVSLAGLSYCLGVELLVSMFHESRRFNVETSSSTCSISFSNSELPQL